jgi:hypothetical protein
LEAITAALALERVASRAAGARGGIAAMLDERLLRGLFRTLGLRLRQRLPGLRRSAAHG